MSDLARLDQAYTDAKRPTDKAQVKLEAAALYAQLARNKAAPNSYETLICDSLDQMYGALSGLAIGLRATYILLEKIEQQQRRG